jgi:hypothetical protein
MGKISYGGYRFPPEIIYQAVWLYLRLTLSFRYVEDLLAERGNAVSYETIRRWVNHFGPMIAADLRKRRPKPDTTWNLDEAYLKIAWRKRDPCGWERHLYGIRGGLHGDCTVHELSYTPNGGYLGQKVVRACQ